MNYINSKISTGHLKCAYLIYLIISLWAVCVHEPWRDEIQAFLIARDSHSLIDLFRHTRYEGHPMLWFLILYILKYISSGIWIVKLAHWMIICCAVYLLMFRSQIYSLWRILISFGYYFTFEYNSIFRNYGVGVLLLFLAMVWIEKKKWSWVAFALILCFQTNVYACIIAASLWANIFLFEVRTDWKKIFFLSCFIAIGAAIIVYFTWPPADSGYARGFHVFNSDRFFAWLDAMCRSYIAIPMFQVNFWNSNLLGNRETTITGGILALFLFIYFVKFKRALVFFLIASIGVGAFLTFKFMGFIRHQGALYIVFLICIWYHSISHRHEKFRFQFIFEVLITCIFILQIYAGCLAIYYDTRYPFSQANHTAEFIKNSKYPYQKNLIITNNNCTSSPILGFLSSDFFYLERNQKGTYVIWDSKNNHPATDSVSFNFLQKGKTLLISAYPIQPLDTLIEKVGEFSPDICGGESYYLYQKKGYY